MSCSWCEARLAPLVDGELTPRERALVARHVAACTPCAALLEELRVVDGLLLQPRGMRLAADFTFATMAEVRDLPPPPAGRRTRLAALVVCYLVGSWLLLLAASILSPDALRAIAGNALDIARTVFDVLGGAGRAFARLTGWMLVADAVLAFVLFAVLRRARPAIAERPRL